MPKPTKIEKLETFLWVRWLLLKIHCEDGTVGIGEGGVHGWQRPTKTMIETMEAYLLGQDPHKIEHHYQWLYRSSHFMGSVVQGALSAIDIALWDIKGKRLGVPIYDLMGGKTRDRVRCYMHVGSGEGGSAEDLANDALDAVKKGYTAVRFSPFPSDYYLHKSYSGWADEAVNRVGAVREMVGPDVDVCVEIHRQMNPTESISLGRRLEQFNPFFYEDPMLPDSPKTMGEIAAKCNIPIATGERFTGTSGDPDCAFRAYNLKKFVGIVIFSFNRHLTCRRIIDCYQTIFVFYFHDSSAWRIRKKIIGPCHYTGHFLYISDP